VDLVSNHAGLECLRCIQNSDLPTITLRTHYTILLVQAVWCCGSKVYSQSLQLEPK